MTDESRSVTVYNSYETLLANLLVTLNIHYYLQQQVSRIDWYIKDGYKHHDVVYDANIFFWVMIP